MSKSRGRRIAFDYGQVRIGVAICDPDAILATPLPFLSASHPKVLKEILTLLEDYQPITIFVGYPRLLSGESGQSVLLVDSFVEELKTITSIPIITIDERLSTVAAGRKLRDSGKSSKDARMHIDSMAAVTILESGLANEDRTQS
jgi:putative Holliday junction resolvase